METAIAFAELPQLFMFEDLYEISLGISAVFLFTSLCWLTILRRKVKEQATLLREQIAREKALRKRYQDIFENASDAILTIDRSGYISSLNVAGEEVLECPRSKARACKFVSFLSSDQIQPLQEWASACSRDKGQAFEATIVSSHGRRTILELLGRPSEQSGALQVIARDITSRRQLADDTTPA